jgi:methylated-DNA-[protein]-cysteine S-methyltransferase
MWKKIKPDQLSYYSLKTPFGYFTFAYSGASLKTSRFTRQPRTTDQSLSHSAEVQFIKNYLKGARNSFSGELSLQGFSEFTCRVLQAIREIPFGKVWTYQQLAKKIGQPKATRAVGKSLSQNPYWILWPCHRVIRSDGSCGGYAGGKDLKKALLAREQFRF